MDWDGILNAWTTKVVPNRTSRIVTRRDSRKSIRELPCAFSLVSECDRSGTEASIDCGNEESVAICRLSNPTHRFLNRFRRWMRGLRAQSVRRTARLPSCCDRVTRKACGHHARLRPRTFFGVEARTHLESYTLP